jgi:hypothetical protein
VLGDWIQAALLGDPADGSVWRLELSSDAPHFTRVPLPNGDRFVEDLTHRLAPGPRPALSPVQPAVVRGEHGLYLATAEGFRPAPAEVRDAAAHLFDDNKIEVTLRGPESFLVRIPASAGAPAFSHLYQPHQLSERMLVWQGRAVSLLRAPLLEVFSLALAGSTPVSRVEHADATIFLDPLVALGTTGLVPINLVLAALLAALTFRRLTRLGVPLPRRLGWCAAVLLTGLLGYLAQRSSENARGWRAVAPAPEEPRRPLLIQTV